MKTRYFFSLVCLSFITLSACKDKTNNDANQATATSESAPNGSVDSKQAYINKYNAYVAVWNDVSPNVEKTYSALYNTINDKTGAPLKNKESYYLPTLQESSAIAGLADILKQEPKIDELDKLGPDLIASYQQILDPVQKLSDYFKLQSYKDDNFEMGKELYFELREPIKKFIAASNNLGVHVQEIDAKLSADALTEYLENDELLLYNKGMLIQTIKMHAAPLYSINYDDYQSLDLEAYDQHLKDIIKYYTEFKSLSKDKERLKREMNISRAAPFRIFYLKVDDYVKEARNLKELIVDTKAYNKMKKNVESMGLNRARTSHVRVTNLSESVINTSNDLNR